MQFTLNMLMDINKNLKKKEKKKKERNAFNIHLLKFPRVIIHSPRF